MPRHVTSGVADAESFRAYERRRRRAGGTLSNSDCAFVKPGNSEIDDSISFLDTKTPRIQVLARGHIDAPQAGIAKQGGGRHFLQRFALQTEGGFDATAAMRFSLEHQNPLVTGWLRTSGTYPETAYSLLTTSNPVVLLWALKPAEDGPASGLVAHFWNLEAKPQDCTVSLSTGIPTAAPTTHIETDVAPVAVQDGKVPLRIAPAQIQAVRIVPAGGARQ